MRWLAACLVAVLVAGCSDPAPAAEEVPVGTAPVAGSLRGYVVSPAVMPIAGASVELLETGQRVSTDKDGAFSFSNLAFGRYAVEATAEGFQPLQADVDFGPASKPIRLQLAAAPKGLAYYTELVWDGFIECSTNYVAVCGALHEVASLTSDTYTTWFDTDTEISHLQTELVWESTQELGDSFWLLHRYATPEEHAMGLYGGSLGAQQGASPLVVKTDVKRYNAMGVGEGNEFVVAVFSGGSDELGLVGITVGQEFQLFLHEFHNMAPHPAWRFTSGLPP